jgi:hypothetical protein
MPLACNAYVRLTHHGDQFSAGPGCAPGLSQRLLSCPTPLCPRGVCAPCVDVELLCVQRPLNLSTLETCNEPGTHCASFSTVPASTCGQRVKFDQGCWLESRSSYRGSTHDSTPWPLGLWEVDGGWAWVHCSPSSILQEEVPYPKRLSLSLSSSSRRELACQRRHAEPGLACSGQSCAAGAGARLTRQDKVVQVSARISCADDTGFEKSVWKCSLQLFSVAACTHLCGPFPAKRGAAAACNACSPHLMLRTLVQTRPEHAGALLAPAAKLGYWHACSEPSYRVCRTYQFWG